MSFQSYSHQQSALGGQLSVKAALVKKRSSPLNVLTFVATAITTSLTSCPFMAILVSVRYILLSCLFPSGALPHPEVPSGCQRHPIPHSQFPKTQNLLPHPKENCYITGELFYLSSTM
ncbi:MAG: hypothetical protein KME25_12415 [Symplocastrum torsivum CPER-KK1]|uniref:Uncharacterized protein n=1 Tax=Symplocastrum torsivum CPER-KK1 TaxID=450513 RepID=A0A951U9S7_9CYAN|nr:hypothetical protein [Symplocastrum torsivum CPER-KK1]